MKLIINFLIALGLLFLLEFVMMILYNTFIDGNISIDTLFGKIFYSSVAIILGGGFLFMLIKAQILYMKQPKTIETKNDTIE